jgi:hypothetical protein
LGVKEDIDYTVNLGLLYKQYKNIALNRFEWSNLPKGIKSRHIEQALYNNGNVAFLKTEKYGLVVLPCYAEQNQNIMGEFTKYRVTGFVDGFNKTVERDIDCVIIDNNMLATPTRPYIEVYTERINEIEKTLDVNVTQQKTPYVIKVNDKNILSFKNLFKKVRGNEPVIYTSKSLDLENIEVFPTLAPFIAIEMMDYKNQVRNELHTFLGINNANTDKKERLLMDEVNSNNEVIESNFNCMLIARQEACTLINEMYGLNISVKARDMGGDDNVGTVHSDTGGDN